MYYNADLFSGYFQADDFGGIAGEYFAIGVGGHGPVLTGEDFFAIDFIVFFGRGIDEDQFAFGSLDEEVIADEDERALGAEVSFRPFAEAGFDIEAAEGPVVIGAAEEAIDIAIVMNGGGPMVGVLTFGAPEFFGLPVCAIFRNTAGRGADAVAGGAVNNVALFAADDGGCGGRGAVGMGEFPEGIAGFGVDGDEAALHEAYDLLNVVDGGDGGGGVSEHFIGFCPDVVTGLFVVGKDSFSGTATDDNDQIANDDG